MLSGSPVSTVMATHGMRYLLRHQSLGFSHLGPGVVSRDILAVHERRQAHDVERKIALAEQLPPIGDHGRQQLTVLESALGVGFTLVPDRARDRKSVV